MPNGERSIDPDNTDRSVYDSGDISVVQNGDVITVTFKDFKFDGTFPTKNKSGGNFGSDREGYFSIGNMQSFVPFYQQNSDVITAYQLNVKAEEIRYQSSQIENGIIESNEDGVVNDNNLKEFTLDFLKQTDFNIEDFDVTEVKKVQSLIDTNLNFKDYQILFKHKGQNNMLSFEEESLGTQMIFVLIPFLSITLKGCGVLIIDELDKSLHPYLVEYIVKMFNSLEYNPRGAQLIFNTHDTNLLDLNFFRRDQVWFTEKNDENGESVLYSLNDFSIRKSENIEKGYMLGRYGAVPFIKNDWNLWDNEEE